VGIDLGPRADCAVVTDTQSPRTVEYSIWSDPHVLADANLTEHENVVVATGAFAKTIPTCAFPAVLEEVSKGDASLVVIPKIGLKASV
jgi:hypothetical protein